jgi:hypothetical protein
MGELASLESLMTQNEIIEMAKQSGAMFDHMTWVERDLFPVFERFAKLVAQHERELIAEIIEDAPDLVEFAQNEQGGCLMCGFTPKLAAEYIRARGQE